MSVIVWHETHAIVTRWSKNRNIKSLKPSLCFSLNHLNAWLELSRQDLAELVFLFVSWHLTLSLISPFPDRPLLCMLSSLPNHEACTAASSSHWRLFRRCLIGLLSSPSRSPSRPASTFQWSTRRWPEPTRRVPRSRPATAEAWRVERLTSFDLRGAGSSDTSIQRQGDDLGQRGSVDGDVCDVGFPPAASRVKRMSELGFLGHRPWRAWGRVLTREILESVQGINNSLMVKISFCVLVHFKIVVARYKNQRRRFLTIHSSAPSNIYKRFSFFMLKREHTSRTNEKNEKNIFSIFSSSFFFLQMEFSTCNGFCRQEGGPPWGPRSHRPVTWASGGSCPHLKAWASAG